MVTQIETGQCCESQSVYHPPSVRFREICTGSIDQKTEVFTIAYFYNKQNNLVNAAWFGLEKSPYNIEIETGWITDKEPINFSGEKTWQDYVKDTRLEMACGETPYLNSIYNVITI